MTESATAPVLELEGLTVRYGRREVLRGISGSLAGRAIGLLGPNGAGKTTLIQTLLGFQKLVSGTARLLGLDIRTESARLKELVGYMPENDAYIAGLSAVRMVTLMAELSGLPPDAALERAHETLFYVGLFEARYRPLESYSLGMKQLAKLAQALVHGPRIVFLDEPTNGLDPPARTRMIKLIREVVASGRVQVVLSSHLLRDVEECCDSVLVLKDGRIVQSCNLEAERRTNRRLLEIETRGGNGSGSLVELLAARGCECAPGRGRKSKVVLAEGLEISDVYRLAAEHDIQIRHLAHKRDSLEDIFMAAMEAS
ncbi:MAG: ABC transporter ATP-binding protein [Thermoanaerobaculia bacterium]